MPLFTKSFWSGRLPLALVYGGLCWAFCLSNGLAQPGSATLNGQPVDAPVASSSRELPREKHGAAVGLYAEAMRFRMPDGTPYLELYYSLRALTLEHQQVSAGFQATARVDIEVRQLPDSQQVFADRISLKGPLIADTVATGRAYLIQHVHRIQLQSGAYVVDITAWDSLQSPAVKKRIRLETFVDDALPADRHLSDILFVEQVKPSASSEHPFERSGLRIEPNGYGNYYAYTDSLSFLVEAYGLDTLLDGKAYYLETNLLQGGTRALPNHRQIFRPRAPKSLDRWVGEYDISELPSNTYALQTVIKTNDGRIIVQRQRKLYVTNAVQSATEGNELLRYDEVYGYDEVKLDSILPMLVYIANETERSTLESLVTAEQKKRFFYTFWARRHTTPQAPEGYAWYNYEQAVAYANQQFTSNIREGWRSDRGRILLTYGPPNNIEQIYDPLNYDVWVYNNLESQSNVIFVFTSNERATNEMILMHSTLRGEAFSPQWAQYLREVTDGTQGYGENPTTLPSNTTGGTRFNYGNFERQGN